MPQRHGKKWRQKLKLLSQVSLRSWGSGLSKFSDKLKQPYFNNQNQADQETVLNHNVLSSSMTTKKTTTKKKVAKKTTKKSNSKKTTKKAASKKVAKKTNGRKLVLAKGSGCFWVNNGPILRDLVELEKAFSEMTDKMFAHHVSGKRNDFADWVEVVLKDKETALALRKSKKPKTARTVVVRQLKLYQLPKAK